MISNFFKVAFRNLFRKKAFSLLNIAGLTIGMASAILILLWVQNEISYDRFHKNGDRLYEVYSNDVINNSIRSLTATPEVMAPVLTHDVSEIECASRISFQQYRILKSGEKILKPKGLAADIPFLTMFSFPLKQGDPATALKDPGSIVLTEKLAKTIFGNENAMGRLILIDNTSNLKVTGVLKDLPNNTLFDFDYLTSYEYNTSNGYVDNDWTDISVGTFVMLKPNASLAAANNKIKNVIVQHSGGRAKTTEFLYPVSRLRLYSDFENGVAVGGRIGRVKIFSIIALFILLIACINFMNLSTARSEKRAREVGVRKVIGARKRSLVFQFMGESVFLSFIAGIFALLLVQISLPAFNQLVKKELMIESGNMYFWIAAVGFIVLTGVLAGSYPALFLASFRPASVLKGTFKRADAKLNPRKALVVLQFTFAIALIVCTIVVEEQVKHAQNRQSGYDQKNLGYVFMQGDMEKNYTLIKNELLNSGAAASVTRAQAPLTQNWSSGISMKWEGKDPNAVIQINRYVEDGGLVKTAGMTLTEGRDIDIEKYPTDSTACLISESAVKAMGFTNPIGQMIYDDPVNWHVVGVIKDFILESPYEPIKPFMVKGPKWGGSVLLIKLNSAQRTAQNLDKVAAIFKKYNPAYPFEYFFIDQEYARKYEDEQLTGTLASLFSMLTIFISCLGLFGLAAYMAENRVKEIGVRKVLGASVGNIVTLLSRDFVKLVGVAILIASPIAWLAMNKWLAGYDYRIDISWWIFVAAGSAALAIAIVTVSYQAIHAALSNPVKSLRSE